MKTSYGAAVLVRNEAESRKLAVYEKYVPDIQDALPLDAADRPSKRGHATPMEVMDAPYRAGDLRYGYQAVADNLPNDPRIHQRKGSKKIFFKNFMEARVNYVILPVAQRLMLPEQADQATSEGYMAGTLLHEIAHELGPEFARVRGKQVNINEAIGPVYSGLEEAKADVVGIVRPEVAGGSRRAAGRAWRNTTLPTSRACSARCVSARGKRTGARRPWSSTSCWKAAR